MAEAPSTVSKTVIMAACFHPGTRQRVRECLNHLGVAVSVWRCVNNCLLIGFSSASEAAAFR